MFDRIAFAYDSTNKWTDRDGEMVAIDQGLSNSNGHVLVAAKLAVENDHPPRSA